MSSNRDLVFDHTSRDVSVQDNIQDDQNDFEFEGKHFRRYHLWAPTIWKIILPISLVISFISVGVLAARTMHDDTSKYARASLCGNSSSEALAIGCSFDHLTRSWYPPNCPHYTNNLFRTAEPKNPFRYYESLESTEPINDDDLFRLIESQGGVWVEKREHLTHCVYMLLAQAQIVRDGVNPVPILVQYGHLEHCASLVLETLRKDDEWHHKNSFTGPAHYNQAC
ncbi:hypothetical protein BJ170DRAFT_581941 [Xylariales sp. AK1849]|nr:hypothetical protein BJ170DRAFT_581941 [Xylariales sp. AK1849]